MLTDGHPSIVSPAATAGSAEAFPLSLAQQRLWLFERIQGPSPAYVLTQAFALRGPLDVGALRAAFAALVQRHASLRTRFVETGGVPSQVVDAGSPVALTLDDWTHETRDRQRQRLAQAMSDEQATPFALVEGPPFRVRLIRLAAQEHVLLRTVHHLVFDGWSDGVLNRDLAVVYAICRAGGINSLPELKTHYGQFAAEQRRRLSEGRLDVCRSYWRRQLADSGELELPADRPRPAAAPHFADLHESVVDVHVMTAIKRIARVRGATCFMALLAAFAALLSRYSGQHDFVIGSPVADRSDPVLESQIGLFVNFLPLRVRLRPHWRFDSLLAEVRATALDAYEHQEASFEQIVREVAPARRRAESIFGRVIFALQNGPATPFHLDDIAVETLPRTTWPRRCDLLVHTCDGPTGLRCGWAYDPVMFDRWRIEQMARHFGRVLGAVAVDPDLTVGGLPMLSADERLRVVDEWGFAHD
jgi:hypothetical protein